MATKRFRSTTGYPVTVMGLNESRNSVEIRVGSDEPFETDDQTLIDVLSGSTEVEEVKGSSDQRNDKEKGNAS